MTTLINRLHGILHYIITYTPFLRHCSQKLLTTISWISIPIFTTIHFLTSLWPSLLSSLSAIASPTSSVQQPKMNRENSHRPIAEQPNTRIDTHPRKQTVQLDRTARSISFCWEREAETRNICHSTDRRMWYQTRHQAGHQRDTEKGQLALETPQRDRPFSRQRKADIITEKEDRTKPTSRQSLRTGIKGQRRIPL